MYFSNIGYFVCLEISTCGHVRNDDENDLNGRDGERRDVLKNVSTKRINQRRRHAVYRGPDGKRP